MCFTIFYTYLTVSFSFLTFQSPSMTQEKRVSAAFYHQEEPYMSAIVWYLLDVEIRSFPDVQRQPTSRQNNKPESECHTFVFMTLDLYLNAGFNTECVLFPHSLEMHCGQRQNRQKQQCLILRPAFFYGWSCQLVSESCWTRLKCLNNCKKEGHTIIYTHSFTPED